MPVYAIARYRRLFASGTLLALALLLASFGAALAHPLGNFTVNRYSRLEPARDSVRVLYILDMAEIPAHAERERIDTDGDGTLSATEIDAYRQKVVEALRRNLTIAVNGRPATLNVMASTLTFPVGQANLPTLRLSVTYVTPITENGPVDLAYADGNYPDRLGWQEIVVHPAASARLLATSATREDVSKELTSYPQDLLTNPLHVASATLQFEPVATANADAGTLNATAQMLATTATTAARPGDPFTDLIAIPDLSPAAIALALAAALGWGAVHTLSPGHGKTIVAAYLVGSRGTTRHALFLGLTTTVTHTAGVFALGFVTLMLSRFILPEQLYPWLSAFSGLIVVAIGLWLVWGRLRIGRRVGGAHGCAHDHGHAHQFEHANAHGLVHDHGDGRVHSHVPPGADGRPVTWRGLLALGVSGGLLPCPSALVLMLGAISLNRIGFGLVLILLFSVGLAGVLTAIGIALVHAGRFFDHIPEGGRIVRLLPVGSALFITVAGAAITVQALAQAGWLAG